MTTVFSAILEIEGHENPEKDARRYLSTIEQIRHSVIDGHSVIDVMVDHQDRECRVKHFRYNYLCKDGCDHKPAPYGVLRYFGLSIVLDGDTDIGNIYKPDPYSELHLCGKTLPYTGKRYIMPRGALLRVEEMLKEGGERWR